MIIMSLAYIEHIFIGISYGLMIYMILAFISFFALSLKTMIEGYKNRQVSKLLGGAYLFIVVIVAVICLITKG